MSNKVGRPSKISEDKILLLEYAFKNLYNVSEACNLAQIGRRTYYDYLDKDEEFANRMELAKCYPAKIAKSTLMKHANQGHIPTSKWLLTKLDPDFNPNNAYGRLRTDQEQEVRRLYDRIFKLQDEIAELRRENKISLN